MINSDNSSKDDFGNFNYLNSTKSSYSNALPKDGEEQAMKEKNFAKSSITDSCDTFSRATIKMIAEQIELDSQITDNAMDLIRRKTKHRLRDLIHTAAQFMHHSFRKKLTTNDLFRAMKELDTNLIFGHNNAPDNEENRPECKYIKVPNTDIFVENDPIIILKKEAAFFLNNKNQNQQQLECKYHKLRKHSFNVEWINLLNQIYDDFYFINSDKEPIQHYHKKLIQVLLSQNMTISEHKLCLKIFYNDLSKNESIKSLISPFIYFSQKILSEWEKLFTVNNISLAIHQTRLRFTKNFLNAFCSIIRNHLFVDISLNSTILFDFAGILLSICFDHFLILNTDNYIQLYQTILDIRSLAAFLFARLFYKFSLPFTDIQHRLIKLLNAKILSRKVNYFDKNLLDISTVDFTILKIFQYLGFDMCLRYLIPLLMNKTLIFKNYFSYRLIGNLKENLIIKIIDNSIRGEINLIGNLIIKSFNLLLTQNPEDFVIIEQSDLIYSFFNQHFGDSLCTSSCTIVGIPMNSINRKLWRKNLQSFLPKKCSKPHENIQLNNKENRMEKCSIETLNNHLLLRLSTKNKLSSSSSSLTNSSLLVTADKLKKIFLYQQDFDMHNCDYNLSNYLILFDGKRIIPSIINGKLNLFCLS